MANEYKYGVNGNDAFANLEPYQGGGITALPGEAYGLPFKGADDLYQGYDRGITIGAVSEPIGPDGDKRFTIDGKPIAGCRKGSVVKAGGEPLFETSEAGTYDLRYSPSGERIIIKKSGKNGVSTQYINKKISRIGLVLVGGGGAAGNDGQTQYTCSDGNFWVEWPGGGGGGGGMLYAILKLTDIKKDSRVMNGYDWLCPTFRITLPDKAIAGGSAGGTATVSVIEERIANLTPTPKNQKILEAYGGTGGAQGNNNSTSGGIGGGYAAIGAKRNDNTGYFENDYFVLIGGQGGGDGGSYSYVDGNVSTSDAASNKIEIKFLQDDTYREYCENNSCGCYGTPEDVIQKKGKAWMIVPGGNSYGRGGYWTIDGYITANSLIQPGIGGGGMDATKGNGSESGSTFSIDADINNEILNKVILTAQGGNAYFALYY